MARQQREVVKALRGRRPCQHKDEVDWRPLSLRPAREGALVRGRL